MVMQVVEQFAPRQAMLNGFWPMVAVIWPFWMPSKVRWSVSMATTGFR
jgi:hypothetical protein